MTVNSEQLIFTLLVQRMREVHFQVALATIRVPVLVLYSFEG